MHQAHRLTLTLTLILILVGLFLAVSGTFVDWQGEMLAPFRLQLFLATVTLAAFAAGLRFPRLALVAAAVAALDATPMTFRLIGRATLPAPASASLSLVSANVLCDSTAYDRVLAMVHREQPDVFVGIETTPDWITRLDTLGVDYPYRFTPAELGVFGLSLYAKAPFDARLLHVGNRGMPLIRAEFATYILYVVHTMPPARLRLEADNRLYLRQLADMAGQETKPVVLAGDFNTTLWSRNMAPLIEDRWQWPLGSGMAYSWPTQRPLMAIQIDQVLTHGFKAGTYRTLGDVGSDHFPVRADLQF